MTDEITKAVNDIKFYLDRIEAQDKRIEALEAALRYYAFEDPFVSYDDSLIARTALGEKKDG